jgi:uncharacterized protein YjiS (DUF1127 family)
MSALDSAPTAMTTIDGLAAGSLQKAQTVTDAVRSIRRRFAARLAARRRYRTVRAELLQYSAQQLAELGISAADIDFVAGSDSLG